MPLLQAAMMTRAADLSAASQSHCNATAPCLAQAGCKQGHTRNVYGAASMDKIPAITQRVSEEHTTEKKKKVLKRSAELHMLHHVLSSSWLRALNG